MEKFNKLYLKIENFQDAEIHKEAEKTNLDWGKNCKVYKVCKSSFQNFL